MGWKQDVDTQMPWTYSEGIYVNTWKQLGNNKSQMCVGKGAVRDWWGRCRPVSSNWRKAQLTRLRSHQLYHMMSPTIMKSTIFILNLAFVRSLQVSNYQTLVRQAQTHRFPLCMFLCQERCHVMMLNILVHTSWRNRENFSVSFYQTSKCKINKDKPDVVARHEMNLGVPNLTQATSLPHTRWRRSSTRTSALCPPRIAPTSSNWS